MALLDTRAAEIPRAKLPSLHVAPAPRPRPLRARTHARSPRPPQSVDCRFGCETSAHGDARSGAAACAGRARSASGSARDRLAHSFARVLVGRFFGGFA